MTSPVTPPTLTSPPPAPDRADRNTFSARATAQAAFYKDVMTPEMQLAINSAQTNAISAGESAVGAQNAQIDAANNAAAAAVNANNAAASAGAAAWVSGTTYAIGARVWSPINQQLYSRITAGAGTTDPKNDQTNWMLVPIETRAISFGSLFLASI